MSFPKRQHWVPRFYLRQFTVPNTNARLEQVWIFHRKEGEPKLTGINNIAAEKYLYTPKVEDGTRDVRLEKQLASLEGAVSQFWPMLASSFVDLGANGIRKGIALFLSVQFLRHPERRDSMRKIRRRIIDVVEQEPLNKDGNPDISHIQIGSQIHPLDTSGWQSYCEATPELDDQLWLEMIEQDATRYAEMLMDKRWSIVFIDDPLFVTSDYPLYVPRPEMERYQVGGDNAVILFPISPTRILCMDDLPEPSNQYYHLENPLADLYNFFTWVNTESFMISPRKFHDVLAGIDRIRTEFEDEMVDGNLPYDG
ncbi:DUF4238 domain-containing protein [bacterium]|nr:DUF4238 domain-containing protein [bacterium]